MNLVIVCRFEFCPESAVSPLAGVTRRLVGRASRAAAGPSDAPVAFEAVTAPLESRGSAVGSLRRLRAVEVGGRPALEVAYDRAGLPTRLTYPDGAVEMHWDPAGRPIRAVQPSGNAATFEYDSAGRLLRAAYPGNVRFAHTYCESGGSATSRFPNGVVLEFGCDPARRPLHTAMRGTDGAQRGLLGVEWQGTTPTRLSSGLPDGRAIDCTGSVLDARFEKDSQPDGSRVLHSPVGIWEYRPDARMRSMTLPSGERFDSMSVPAGGRRGARHHAFHRGGGEVLEYSIGSRIHAMAHADGTRTAFVDGADATTAVAVGIRGVDVHRFDAQGRLVAIRSTDGRYCTLSRDRRGRVKHVETGTGWTRISYDRDDRIRRVRTSSGIEARLDYDDSGLPERMRLRNAYRDTLGAIRVASETIWHLASPASFLRLGRPPAEQEC